MRELVNPKIGSHKKTNSIEILEGYVPTKRDMFNRKCEITEKKQISRAACKTNDVKKQRCSFKCVALLKLK